MFFADTSEHIIKECVYMEANKGDSRPFSDFKKKFKFPLFTMSKNSIPEHDLLEYDNISVSKRSVVTAKHKSELISEQAKDFTYESTTSGLKMYKDDVVTMNNVISFLYEPSSSEFVELMEGIPKDMSEPNKGEFMFLMKFRLFEVAYLISNLSMNTSCLAKSASKGFKGLISRIYPEDSYILYILPNNKLISTNNVSFS